MSADILSRVSGLATGVLEIAGWEVLFSLVVFVTVLGLCRLLRDAAPALRHALWALVLVRLVIPVDLTHPASLGALVAHLDLHGKPAAWLEEWPGHGGVREEGLASDPVAAADSGETGPVTSGWPLALALLWAAGSLAVGTRVLRQRATYRRVLRDAMPPEDPEVLARLSDLKARMGVRRGVRIVTARTRRMPFTCGTFRPVIFLPRALLEHPEQNVRDAVLAHELAHIARWDDLVLRVRLLISVLYFFNPAAWLAGSRMRTESERACDELAVARSGLSARDYGRSVLTVLKLGLADGPRLVPAFGNRKRRLRMRIESIVRTSAKRPGGRPSYPLPAALVLGFLLLPMAGFAGGERPTADQETITLANPMPGARITSRYGPTTDPFSGAEAHHDGIDVAGPGATPILAPAPGRVELATTDYRGGASYGTVVLLDHGGGLKTFYSHLGRLAVRAGQRVDRGELLGVQGATGRVTGPHLHFEVRVDGEPRDPAAFVADWRGDIER